jgi:uncharacterized protein YggL (DUF469 family)
MSAPCPTFGFAVSMELVASPDRDARDELRQAWLAFLERRGLYAEAVSGNREPSIDYVVGSESAQATNNDRAAVEAWLQSRRELVRSRVGELIDLNQAV